jgi:hypothetical protein
MTIHLTVTALIIYTIINLKSFDPSSKSHTKGITCIEITFIKFVKKKSVIFRVCKNVFIYPSVRLSVNQSIN